MTTRDRERIEELLAQHVCEGLSPRELAELRALGVSEREMEAAELAAAAAALAMLGEREPMPASLRQRVEKTAPVQGLRLTGDRGRSTPSSGGGVLPWLGWLAAAAAIMLAVYAWLPATGPGGGTAPVQTAAERRQALLAQADAVQSEWSAWGEAPAVPGVEGDVVWSQARQEGYMRFRGLKPNNPGEAQYQLWIVDASRGTPLEVPPVDGGVFDVDASGEVIVPIRAKLPVGDAFAFAVTVEPPGGVVVSDQSQKVVVAMVPR